ncbi:unnamed protein product [Heligmosomoides polygyrus]|uniref:Uncharacterized protein n=1 Tax=Heligmosomoides polygyrus TaxID=6339 RepID=A0A3P7TMU6_HELPZ|nr:unnamed protein product [Heligmosomoides polygyrus]
MFQLARRGPRSPHRTHINGGDPPSSTGSDVNQTVSGDESAPASHDGELPMERIRRAFGRNDYLLPENFKTLRRSDIPVTYRLHDDLLRYYSVALTFSKNKNYDDDYSSPKSPAPCRRGREGHGRFNDVVDCSPAVNLTPCR